MELSFKFVSPWLQGLCFFHPRNTVSYFADNYMFVYLPSKMLIGRFRDQEKSFYSLLALLWEPFEIFCFGMQFNGHGFVWARWSTVLPMKSIPTLLRLFQFHGTTLLRKGICHFISGVFFSHKGEFKPMEYFLFLKKNVFMDFLERGRERDIESKTLIGWLLHAP